MPTLISVLLKRGKVDFIPVCQNLVDQLIPIARPTFDVTLAREKIDFVRQQLFTKGFGDERR